MKLIYIGKEELNSRYRSLFKSRLVEIVHYKNPLKAVDNLIEISPDIIFMNREDFPRMWKIVLSEVSNNLSQKVTFILYGELDSEEEKAFTFLGGRLNISEIDKGLMELKDLIKPTTAIKEIYISEEDELSLGFVNPLDFSFINGTVLELSEETLMLKYDKSNDLSPLIDGKEVVDASLSYGEIVATISLKVLSTNSVVICTITAFDSPFKELLSQLFV